VLDMGEPIRVADIARHLIRLHGKQPDTDVKLAFVGLRPGEKLREELFDVNEERSPVVANGILSAFSLPPRLTFLQDVYEALERTARSSDQAAMQRLIRFILPNYRPYGSATSAPAPALAVDADQGPARGLDDQPAAACDRALDLRVLPLGPLQVSLQQDHPQ